jgi:acyl carrier protein
MTQAEAMKWIADVFEEDAAKLSPDLNREDFERWDSLGMLTLIAALDEQFSIVLNEDEMGKLTSINSILEVLRRHKVLDSSVN